jgi:hypothetical protein
MSASFRLSSFALLPFATSISARFVNFDVSGGQVLCPLRLCTGLQCPTCGSTRSLLALLSGRPLQAIEFNPALIAIISALAFTKLYQLRLFGNLTFPQNNSSYIWPNLREDRVPVVIVLLLLFAWAILRNF